MGKTKIQLQEDVAQLEADLSAAIDQLGSIRAEAGAEVDKVKAEVRENAEKQEADRQAQLTQARAAYDQLLSKAMSLTISLQAQKPELLGIAGQAARDAQLNMIKELFGEI